MRYAFKAVDFGASIVFMAMCAKAFLAPLLQGHRTASATTKTFLSLRTRLRSSRPK
jgi:hypothetical protein